MYEVIKYKYFNTVVSNYNILYFDNLLKKNKFIIFFNCCKITNLNLLNLKNEISKYNLKTFILNKKLINIIFNKYFKFLSSYIFCIFINDFNTFIKIIKLLNNINFFYSFNKIFSNILNKNIILSQIDIYNKYLFLNYILFKILHNILFIILYLILILLKFLN